MQVVVNAQGGQTVTSVRSSATSMIFGAHHHFTHHEFHIRPVMLGGKGLGKGAPAFGHSAWEVSADCDIEAGVSNLLAVAPHIPVPMPGVVYPVPVGVETSTSTSHSQIVIQ